MTQIQTTTVLGRWRPIAHRLMISGAMLMGFAQSALAQETTEITVWFGRENFIPADAFESFHAANPDIQVTTDVVRLEQAVADTLRAAQSNRAPDIVQVPADGLAPLVAQGAVRDVSSLLEAWRAENPAALDDISSVGLEMASLDGTPYGVTLYAGPFWYTYRKDWLNEVSLDEPQTWDDVLEFARAAKAEGYTGFALIGSRAHDPVWFLSAFMSMGGQFENGVPQLDSEAGHYLLGFYQTLVREELTSPDVLAWDSSAMRTAFIGGEAAQALLGDNIYPTLNESLEWDAQWAGARPPARPGAEEAARTMTLGWPFLVTTDAAEDAAILKVMQYLAHPENVGEVSARYQPGTVLSVFESEDYNGVKPWASSFAEAFSDLAPLPTHPRQTQIYQILLDAMQEALNTPDGDPAAIAAKHQAAIRDLVGG
ncbi:ABC-type glycerol-3-phosphate transport system substrate-binding protein [Limimaricola variabilis]|uniref:ABC-type glycerol-3-phosphate transport system substrate-binding protein n=1 Tax=Limimaricola variabilis TaxID=1492771 RepID=A0ABR6HRK9_9RHOB|nr:extracellular solute-binding protein [Limimaricola variabilis]MBB3713060.1 ABC-type glycerol-3-phosphate transport system substrate-binding protein [Limimaricola variabilis]